ncbi:uncharacterized protein LTR77_001877 [Saxophila tyrrhenica]|uniref:RING-type domain-containing protein n=1 Tax=Saxophila tyrrhenica TaxID=1690608 RepID=A0AAV9PMR4_9PEZI|nr:hypothetical protein LTR77_001877 [Saxophila tyrrhenica]
MAAFSRMDLRRMLHWVQFEYVILFDGPPPMFSMSEASSERHDDEEMGDWRAEKRWRRLVKILGTEKEQAKWKSRFSKRGVHAPEDGEEVSASGSDEGEGMPEGRQGGNNSEDGEGAEDVMEDKSSLEDGEGDEAPYSPLQIFAVAGVTRDEAGYLIDLRLQQLSYNKQPAGATEDDRTVPVHSTRPFTTLQNLAAEIAGRPFGLIINPTGDDARNFFFSGWCPAGCDHGFVDDQDVLHQLLLEPFERIDAYRPLCPVCIGVGYARQYNHLRSHRFDNTIPIDQVETFYSHLNARLLLVHNTHYDFDAGDLGQLFADMRGEFTPTRDSPIREAAPEEFMDNLLPRQYHEVEGQKADACGVCQDDFKVGTAVLQLSCEHVLCEECVIRALRVDGRCPSCRYRLSQPAD